MVKLKFLFDIFNFSAVKTDSSTKETEQKYNMEGQTVIFHFSHF